MKKLRQERDPNFRKAQVAKAEADTTAMPPPPSRMPPKRKKGLGYQVIMLKLSAAFILQTSDLCTLLLSCPKGSCYLSWSLWGRHAFLRQRSNHVPLCTGTAGGQAAQGR